MSHAIPSPLSPAELSLIQRYWSAANYLSVGQIYLLDNPLLREPLRVENGNALPPDRPGLGLEWDEAALKHHAADA